MSDPVHGLVARVLSRNKFVQFILAEGGNPFNGFILSSAILSGFSSSAVLASLSAAASAMVIGAPLLLMGLAFAISLIAYIFSTQYLMRATGREIEYSVHRLRLRLIKKLRGATYRSIEELGGSRLYAAIGGEVQTISRAGTNIVMLVQSVILLFFAALYLAWLSFAAFAMLSVFSLIVGSVYVSHARRLRAILYEAMQAENRLFDYVADFLNGFREIRMNTGRSREIYHDFIASSERTFDDKSRAIAALATDNVFAQSSMYLLIACVIFVLPQISGSTELQMPTIATVLLFMFGPLSSILSADATFAAANSSAKSLEETERLLVPQAGEEHSEKDTSEFCGIELHEVAYSRRDPAGSSTFRLGPINLSVNRGEVLFVTGGNGSGKSTLLNVLVGLYPHDSGEFLMNGKVLDSGSIHLWQQHISAVFYNFHLFPKPYGLVLHSTEYVVELMQELELDLDLLKPDGYFRNLALSAGQRKRLALITALLENRPVLVLDEWAADQDPYFKKKFYTKIVPSLRDRGKTIVAITHDDAYFSVADRVLKMDNGSIKQEVDV